MMSVYTNSLTQRYIYKVYIHNNKYSHISTEEIRAADGPTKKEECVKHISTRMLIPIYCLCYKISR